MEINFATGLMNESRLKKRIAMQRRGGVLYVMTIENINMTKTQFIALIRTGVIIAPKKDFVGSRK
jgi:hypothetical protein